MSQTLALVDLKDLEHLLSKSKIKNEIWSAKQAADYLDISKPTLLAQVKAGKIPGEQVGNDWKFSSIALFCLVAKEDIKTWT